MTEVRKSLLAAIFLLLGAGCAKPIQNPQVKASPLIKNSFTAVRLKTDVASKTPSLPAAPTGPLSVQDQYLLGLKKSALEKEFLLNASIIPQEGAATSTGLKGRIVAFRRRGQSVYMLEASQGHVVTDDLPSSLVLAEIPIVRETVDTLILDFNKGMSQVFVTKGWRGSDTAGKDYSSSTEAAHVWRSFIQSIDLDGSLMEIRQVAQLDVAKEGSDSFPTYEVRYYISPYLPQDSFKRKETSDFSQVGFFEVAPLLETTSGRATSYIVHWDTRQPIVYYVSANTPPEFVQAVKDGVLYWNSAFGRQVVQVEVAPKGVTAPDPRYNLIQWVPYDNSGYAYADALMDPRTGQILHAQVYLTSAFSFVAKATMPAILRKLKAGHDSTSETSGGLGLNFLEPSRICDLDLDPTMIVALQNAAAKSSDPKTFLKIAQDYVRATVAHEVGHTLGLRHNFAGNLGSRMSLEERNKAFADYVLNGTPPPDTPLTSSVMDYLVFQDDILTARQIANHHGAFDYDKDAIQWAYADQDLPKDAPLFCTDSQVGTFDDCQQFDSGKYPLLSDYASFLSGIKSLPVSFTEKFISARAPVDSRDRRPVERVAIDPSKQVTGILDFYKKMIHWFSKSARSLSVERQFPVVGPLNQDQVNTAKMNWVAEQVKTAGGLDKLLFAFLPATDRPALDFEKESQTALEAYLARPEVKSSLRPDGGTYTLTENEVAFIKKLGPVYFAKVNESLTNGVLEALTAAPYDGISTDLSGQLEKRLAAVADFMVTAQGDPLAGAPADVHQFKYKFETRAKAVKLLSAGLGAPIDWSLDGRMQTFVDLVKIVQKSMGTPDISKIDDTQLARPLRQWFMEQEMFLKALQQ